MYKIDPTLNSDELIDHIRSRYQVTIQNIPKTKSYLTFINYSRLIDYLNKLSITEPKIDFIKVIKYYDFDRKLKLLAMDGIERIEISFRALLLNELVLSTKDEVWYCNKIYYHNQPGFEKTITLFSKYILEQKDSFLILYFKKRYKTFDLEIWSEVANLFLRLSREIDTGIKANNNKIVKFKSIGKLGPKTINYLKMEIKNLPDSYAWMSDNINEFFINQKNISLLEIISYLLYTLNVPFYLIVDALTIGQLSRLYPRLRTSFKQKIANKFKNGLQANSVKQHIDAISKLRNIIAHHDRLFNVSKLIKIDNFDTLTIFNGQSAKVYFNLISYYLNQIAPHNTFKIKLNDL